MTDQLRQAAQQATCKSGLHVEQPRQEPVAWANINKHGDITHTSNKRTAWARTPLYTTPQPAREWVGLTDEEIVEALRAADKVPVDEDGWVWKQRIKWSRAIEARLKEKNHG